MEKIFETIQKLLDNFNLGRAIIYTTVGAFITIPFWFLFWCLLSPNIKRMPLYKIFLQFFSFISNNLFTFLFSSYILSFCFISGMYVQLKKIENSLLILKECPELNKYYCHLNDKKALQWLISEYYRFLEAAFYIPFSWILGLWFLTFSFLLLYLFLIPVFILPLLISLLLSITFYFLYQYWVEKIIPQIYLSYLRAKFNLIYSALSFKDNKTHTTNQEKDIENTIIDKKIFEDLEKCLDKLKDV